VKELKGRLKPGDILFTAPHRKEMGVFSRYIFKPVSRKIQHTDYGHASLYVGKGHIMEARMGEGTKRRSLRHVARKNHIIAFRPNVPHEESQAAVSYAVRQHGRPYSMKHLIQSAFPVRSVFGRRHSRKPEESQAHICSTLVANAYPRRQFSGVSRLVTRPSEIMQSSILSPVGSFRRSEA